MWIINEEKFELLHQLNNNERITVKLKAHPRVKLAIKFYLVQYYGFAPKFAFFDTCFYCFLILNVIAFNATIIVESDIKIAPTAGVKITPTGAKIPAAIGIAIKL